MEPQDYTSGQPIGVFPAFVAQRPTYLVVKERLSLSGDDFTIRTSEGADILRCEGKTLSLSGRKNLYAPDGTHLFALRAHTWHIPKSYYLEDPAGERVVDIKGRWTLGKAKLDAHFENRAGAGGEAVFELRGHFFDRKADILFNGACVARIRREFMNVREMFGNMQTYMVWVAPGVDLTLISALVIALDEQRSDEGGGAN